MQVSDRNKAYSGNVEWYTPQRIMNIVRCTLDTIDLDPASTPFANETVQANHFYTKEEDGLSRPWFGNIFCNPPYSGGMMPKFADKLLGEFREGRIAQAIMLTNSATDTQWYHDLLMECTAACLTKGRIRFVSPDGEPGKSPVMGQTFFYFGPRPRIFRGNFVQLGSLVFPTDEYQMPMPF